MLRPIIRYITALVIFFAGTTLVGCGEESGPTAPCTPGACFSPPTGYCRGDEKVSFGVVGTCGEFGCSYEMSALPCEHGCNGKYTHLSGSQDPGQDDRAGHLQHQGQITVGQRQQE